MFNNLQDKLDKALHNLSGRGKITEINVAETVKEIRRALVDADVNYKVAKDLTKRVQDKALGQNVLTSLTPGQLMTKIVHDELVELMGGSQEGINLSGKPSVILIAGLQGSGKTTFSGKLANYLKKKRSKNPLLVACDVYRPAAIDQLKVLGTQIDVPVYTEIENKNPAQIAENAIQFATHNRHDVVIVDTAGRLAVDEEMMNEIKRVHQTIKPHETLFVVDSMTGQDAVNTAKAFNDTLNFDGVVLTKLDGDTRGGAALTIRSVVEKPIKFISTGEKMEALDLFYPERMADRILGMGDVVSLVERAQEQFDEEEAKKLHKKIAKNEFGFDDFLKQIHQIKRMGNMKDLMGMIPGVGKAIKDVDIDDNSFKHIEAIIYSMTPEERRKPTIIDMNRKKRIAKGSGRKLEEVNQLMKQFDQMGKMMKMMQGPQGKQLMQMMSKMGGGKMPGMPNLGGLFGR
ncbi:MAG: signal recognition particle protein [Bergeyella zoohelcum]|nr:signal recognition particle protein [Bergeyella zoohelcum]